jgi:hypothetical protein
MAHIDGPTLSAFQDLVKGVHDFDEQEMERLQQMAHEVTAIVHASVERAMAHTSGAIHEGMTAVSQHGSMPGGFPNEVGHWNESGNQEPH